MKNDFDSLTSCPLFSGILEPDLKTLLRCLDARARKFQKDEILFSAGDPPKSVGVMLSGSVYIVQEDYWGNRTILASIEKGEIFGEAFSCAQVRALPVSVIARQPGSVLLIDCQKVLSTCPSSCGFHTVLIHNLTKVLANKNIALTRKMEHITRKTTREKVLSYLSQCAVLAGKDTFEIPFNRQELADYLSVERSALSNTLSKMRQEGILEYHKNRFRIV